MDTAVLLNGCAGFHTSIISLLRGSLRQLPEGNLVIYMKYAKYKLSILRGLGRLFTLLSYMIGSGAPYAGSARGDPRVALPGLLRGAQHAYLTFLNGN